MRNGIHSYLPFARIHFFFLSFFLICCCSHSLLPAVCRCGCMSVLSSTLESLWRSFMHTNNSFIIAIFTQWETWRRRQIFPRIRQKTKTVGDRENNIERVYEMESPAAATAAVAKKNVDFEWAEKENQIWKLLKKTFSTCARRFAIRVACNAHDTSDLFDGQLSSRLAYTSMSTMRSRSIAIYTLDRYKTWFVAHPNVFSWRAKQLQQLVKWRASTPPSRRFSTPL